MGQYLSSQDQVNEFKSNDDIDLTLVDEMSAITAHKIAIERNLNTFEKDLEHIFKLLLANTKDDLGTGEIIGTDLSVIGLGGEDILEAAPSPAPPAASSTSSTASERGQRPVPRPRRPRVQKGDENSDEQKKLLEEEKKAFQQKLDEISLFDVINNYVDLGLSQKMNASPQPPSEQETLEN